MENNEYTMRPIFGDRDRAKAAFIRENGYCRLSALSSAEVRELAVVWSFYSGKIEGNTYDLVETQTLLLDDVSATRKYEDAVMLKNLYNVFIAQVERVKGQGVVSIDDAEVLRIHAAVADKLLDQGACGVLRDRPVMILNSTYVPPSDVQQIRRAFDTILAEQHRYPEPLERAVYLHCNMARLQPFRDGNKRTARLLESVVMLNADLIPVYSSDAADIAAYRKALNHFYQTRDYTPYKDYFLDRQLRRVQAMLPAKSTESAKVAELLTAGER